MPNGDILPTFPYTLSFSTRGGLRYTVKSDDATRFIPKPDADGQVRSAVIVFDFSNRQHLPSGRLSFTMKAEIPNDMYPDGYQDITEPHPTNAELWDGATDYKEAVEVELILPYVKGEAGKGVPAGGSKGQVLTKNSDTDFDSEWSDPKGGSADIKPNSIGSDELKDGAVTPEKLSPELIDKINDSATKEEVKAVSEQATNAASSAQDAANAAQAAGTTAQNAQTIANNALNQSSKAVRYDEAQELTTSQQLQARANIAAMANTPSGDPMHYMYEQAGAVWNAETGYWELNTLTDLTTAEMRQIYAEAHLSQRINDIDYFWYNTETRTNINGATIKIGVSCISMFSGAKQLEVAHLSKTNNTFFASNLATMFDGCHSLKTVLSLIYLNTSNPTNISKAFRQCYALINISLRNLSMSIDLSYSPNLSVESGRYMINNSTATTPITILVHHDAYVRFMADPTILAALEAHPLVTLADAGATINI